jgi:hypothetical protein
MVSAPDAHSAPDSSRHPSSDADDGLFDGREMIMVHDVLRREFGLLPDVVAIGRSLEDWAPQFMHYRRAGYRLIAPDLPGSGFSDRLPASTTLQALTQSVLETSTLSVTSAPSM